MIDTFIVTPATINRLKARLDSDVPVVLLYHMNTCPHCIMMRAAWEATKQFLSFYTGLCIAEVEYGQMHLLPKELQGIRGFPTIKIFNKGTSIEYAGDRSQDSMSSFILKNARPVKATKRKPVAKPKKRTFVVKKNRAAPKKA